MIDDETLVGVISLYNRHGWELRRALLSESVVSSLGPKAAHLAKLAVVCDDLNALWFSRARGEQITWEIRSLHEPFALVRVIDSATKTEEVEAVLRDAQEKLRARQQALSTRG